MPWNLLKQDPYRHFLAERVSDPPQGRVVQVVLLRWTDSYAVFTTEGQEINTEVTRAGLSSNGRISRAVLFKRKQVAAERRTGKAWRRQYADRIQLDALWQAVPGEEREKILNCSLIQNLCGLCPDCILYGFAAQEETRGSIPSRVWTDTAFSIGPVEPQTFTLNAVDEVTHTTEHALAEREHLPPGIVFPSVETLVDVTPAELVYVLSNILRTRRYGAEKSRAGVVRSIILDVFFGDTEKFTNLELSQRFYDALATSVEDWSRLPVESLQQAWPTIRDQVMKDYPGVLHRFDALDGLHSALKDQVSSEDHVVEFLRQLEEGAVAYHQSRSSSSEAPSRRGRRTRRPREERPEEEEPEEEA